MPRPRRARHHAASRRRLLASPAPPSARRAARRRARCRPPRRSGGAVEELGERQVEAPSPRGPVPSRRRSRCRPPAPQFTATTNTSLAPRGVVRVHVRAREEGPVLDLDGVQVARAGADEGELRGRGLLRLDGRSPSSVRRAFQSRSRGTKKNCFQDCGPTEYPKRPRRPGAAAGRCRPPVPRSTRRAGPRCPVDLRVDDGPVAHGGAEPAMSWRGSGLQDGAEQPIKARLTSGYYRFAVPRRARRKNVAV
jgi:hypothetical protein